MRIYIKFTHTASIDGASALADCCRISAGMAKLPITKTGASKYDPLVPLASPSSSTGATLPASTSGGMMPAVW